MPGSGTAIVLLSGGIDSAACAHLLGRHLNVEGVHVSFGQESGPHELSAARAVAKHLRMPLHELTLSGAGSFSSGEIWARNAFLLTAALLATGGRATILAIGVHAGTPYFDCSPAFVQEINHLVQATTDGRVSVQAPFLEWSKGETIDYFLQSGIPLEMTYSCENGTLPPCGACLSCRDRVHLSC